MSPKQPPAAGKTARRAKRALAVCVGLCFLGGLAAAWVLLRPGPPPERPDTDVPLGVEQAVIIRYSGPRLEARPYRRGASVNLRIANQSQKGRVRIYDVRYVVSLPGQFDVTEYLTSADGRPIDDLPPFRVRGLTSLTKDIETRIREIENVGVHIRHWYYESLAALGVFWAAWLAGLIFIGRPKRPPAPPPPPRQPSLVEQIAGYLDALARGELSVADKARLEALLLCHWRERLGLVEQRMAASCRGIERDGQLGDVYRKLQSWLHNPRAGVGPEQFVEAYAGHDGNGPARTAGPARP